VADTLRQLHRLTRGWPRGVVERHAPRDTEPGAGLVGLVDCLRSARYCRVFRL